MLQEGRIPLNPEEHDAVEQLLEHADGSLTRSDPAEAGVLLVEISGKTWEIAADGTTEEVG